MKRLLVYGLAGTMLFAASATLSLWIQQQNRPNAEVDGNGNGGGHAAFGWRQPRKRLQDVARGGEARRRRRTPPGGPARWAGERRGHGAPGELAARPHEGRARARGAGRLPPEAGRTDLPGHPRRAQRARRAAQASGRRDEGAQRQAGIGRPQVRRARAATPVGDEVAVRRAKTANRSRHRRAQEHRQDGDDVRQHAARKRRPDPPANGRQRQAGHRGQAVVADEGAPGGQGFGRAVTTPPWRPSCWRRCADSSARPSRAPPPSPPAVPAPDGALARGAALDVLPRPSTVACIRGESSPRNASHVRQ